MRRGPAYLGGAKPLGWRRLVGCGVATLIVLILAYFLAFYLIHVFCPGGHCQGPPPDVNTTAPVQP